MPAMPTVPPSPRPSWSVLRDHETVERILVMKAEGAPTRAIARETRITFHTVHNVLTRNAERLAELQAAVGTARLTAWVADAAARQEVRAALVADLLDSYDVWRAAVMRAAVENRGMFDADTLDAMNGVLRTVDGLLKSAAMEAGCAALRPPTGPAAAPERPATEDEALAAMRAALERAREHQGRMARRDSRPSGDGTATS